MARNLDGRSRNLVEILANFWAAAHSAIAWLEIGWILWLLVDRVGGGVVGAAIL